MHPDYETVFISTCRESFRCTVQALLYSLSCICFDLQTLKTCFETKDIGMLQKVILEMPKEEAEYHMKRCVDSGLWVPNANEAGDSLPVQEEGDRGEETYEDVH